MKTPQLQFNSNTILMVFTLIILLMIYYSISFKHPQKPIDFKPIHDTLLIKEHYYDTLIINNNTKIIQIQEKIKINEKIINSKFTYYPISADSIVKLFSAISINQ